MDARAAGNVERRLWIVATIGGVCALLAVLLFMVWPRLLRSSEAVASSGVPASFPVAWACEMGCEGAKTYPTEGSCPVCGMALNRASDKPYSLAVEALSEIVPGKPASLRVRMLDPAGTPVRAFAKKRQATRPALIAIVSDDLAWHWADAPEIATGADGEAVITPIFPAPGRYEIYADFRPIGLARQIPSAAFKVVDPADKGAKGTSPESMVVQTTAFEEDFDVEQHDDPYLFHIRCNGSRFFAGTISYLRFGIDIDGKSVDGFETIGSDPGRALILSVASHRVVQTHAMSAAPFMTDSPVTGSPDPNLHIHKHPAGAAGTTDSPNPLTLRNGRPTDVVVQCVFPEPGLYRVFACFRHNGRTISAAYTIDAQPLPAHSAAAPTGSNPK